MIRCNLSTMMGARRLNIESVAEGAGIGRDTVSKYYHDRLKRIDYASLNRLCIFFDCEVGDILKRVREKNDKKLLMTKRTPNKAREDNVADLIQKRPRRKKPLEETD
ncbi:MAG: helix-turn-helix transcriptional regulator [Nitrospirae bacterium]|nr:helix-turn-helix transcriptional regulator [Nitrospirota bacterium]